MNEVSSGCPVCLGPEEVSRPPGGFDALDFDCARCGRFRVNSGNEVMLRDLSDATPDFGKPRLGPGLSQKRLNASAWVRNRPGVRLNYDDIVRLATLPTPSVLEVVDEVLLALESATTYPGEQINLNVPEWKAILRVWDRKGVIGLAELMEEIGVVVRGEGQSSGPNGRDPVRISARGWHRLEELQRVNPDSPQGFVAMSFNPQLVSLYDGAIAPAIEAAGYTPYRVDRDQFTGKIDDRIIAAIRRSRFVVADLTGERPSVYYEAGWGHGLGLETFFIAKKGTDLHFDLRQHNTIFWEAGQMEELMSVLQNRIESVLGRGPVPPSVKRQQTRTGRFRR